MRGLFPLPDWDYLWCFLCWHLLKMDRQKTIYEIASCDCQFIRNVEFPPRWTIRNIMVKIFDVFTFSCFCFNNEFIVV